MDAPDRHLQLMSRESSAAANNMLADGAVRREDRGRRRVRVGGDPETLVDEEGE
jgi:hypothetical protein